MSDRYEQLVTEDSGVDTEIHGALRAFDPGEGDAGYWTRFEGWVLSSASMELARRRRLASMTIGDVLVGWARALVPTAMVAAALAGLFLVRSSGADALPPLGLEEILASELQGLTILQISSPDAPGNPIALTAEMF